MITGSKLILVRISLQKVDLGEDYTQKVQENFRKRSTSDTIDRLPFVKFGDFDSLGVEVLVLAR